ncbi:hypothetical protein ASE86_15235 [Sphingomonas sp. Leaf33]|uniref:DUF1176 domain-containing protein n=1 Tax=Sphingomonas sp. Leaf33 TaxID=1736215 RepID=UPI0006F55ED8|nr:DUF1176 domain-containing protein [Sphingomonas sp. Leaf33]KQN20604.1 hypothetical protein ASE86_15235 [Sphingomonas sp. Leaf33]
MIRIAAPLAMTLALLPAAAMAQGVPKPGAMKTFGDWTVGCDNTNACMMLSLGTEDPGEAPPTTLLIERAGGGASDFCVTVQPDDDRPRGIAVDGRRLATGRMTYDGAAADAIGAAMATGRKLQILATSGTAQSTLSLTGASAALRYIDAVQHRVGTVTAAVARGSAPAARVPAPPAPPVVIALRPSGTAARPSAAQVAAMRKAADCDPNGLAGDSTPEQHALGGGATLVLVPCSAGAYNLASAAFVLRGGKVAPARADVPTGYGEDASTAGPAVLVNAAFENGVLSSYSKGRGVGDCGISQNFVWDGARLRLVEQAQMIECRGNTGLATTWRADVRRR